MIHQYFIKDWKLKKLFKNGIRFENHFCLTLQLDSSSPLLNEVLFSFFHFWWKQDGNVIYEEQTEANVVVSSCSTTLLWYSYNCFGVSSRKIYDIVIFLDNFVLICVLMSWLFWTSFLAMYLAMNLQTLNFFCCLARQKIVVPFHYLLLKLVFLMN